MKILPTPLLWRAEGLRLRRQPLAWVALSVLLAVLFACAVSAGLEARRWRAADVALEARLAASWQTAVEQFNALPPGTAAATATYQLGRSDLGTTRMTGGQGLGLGVKRLQTLPHQLRVSLDSRFTEARTTTQLRNPLLAQTGLPDLPAIVALLIPLVAIVLCAGLLQEEREQGRLGLLRVQLRAGRLPLLMAALGWRCLALIGVTVLGTLPALVLDPGATLVVGLQWSLAAGTFVLIWVVFGGLLSLLPWSTATTLLAGIGCWLLTTFALPAALVWMAERQAPMPSRLASILQIRQAQQDSETHEAELADDWYAAHPAIEARLPAVWPASFVPRALAQDRQLQPVMKRFEDSRQQQAALIERWAWWSPGLTLVLTGQRLAGADTHSHLRYLRRVEAFEARWRESVVPSVMDGRGLSAEAVATLPRWE